MKTLLYERLEKHCGHDVAIVKYGFGKGCYTLECEDCNEVICDTDLYDLKANEEDHVIESIMNLIRECVYNYGEMSVNGDIYNEVRGELEDILKHWKKEE